MKWELEKREIYSFQFHPSLLIYLWRAVTGSQGKKDGIQDSELVADIIDGHTGGVIQDQEWRMRKHADTDVKEGSWNCG